MARENEIPDRPKSTLPVEMLLATKLFVPQARSFERAVKRLRLLNQLTEGLSNRLTLISAPAGYGKTTLLGEWLGTDPCYAAWISLDAGDNDLARFINYLSSALSTIFPAVGEAIDEVIRASGSLTVQPILTALINQFAAAEATGNPPTSAYVLVLDDYHVIDNPSIHEMITFLIDHLPPQLHLIIATRVDPPLPLARWRSRAQMIELRADDLRFDGTEAVVLLNQVMQLNLLPEDISTLVERTEGWVVGLQMAALSLRGRSPERIAAFVRAFGGGHRYILDYLVEEVLGCQPEDVQVFLVKTSVLERLTAPLCEAVTGQSDGQSMLEGLEKANLFLVPLDDERRWYRYHHLFVELLRTRLHQTHPDAIAQLHSYAAEWYAANDVMVDAVGHALAARDFKLAVPLIQRSAIDLLSRGEMTTLLSWLDALPEEIVFEKPDLCVICAWILAFSGNLDKTEPLLCAAEGRLGQAESSSATQGLLGQITAIRTASAATRGDSQRAIDLGCKALELLPPSIFRVRGIVYSALGNSYTSLGDFEHAERAYQGFAEVGMMLEEVWTFVLAKCELADLRKIQGKLNQAEELYHEALAWVADKSQHRLETVGMVAVGLSDLFRERNDLDAAYCHVMDGIAHMPWTDHRRWWESPNPLAAGYATLARVHQVRGQLDEAQDAIQQAKELSRSYDVQPEVCALIQACQVRLWLAEDKVEELARWQQETQVSVDDALDPARELAHISLARILLKEDKPDQAEHLLDRLAVATAAGGRYGRLIEILILQALAIMKTANRIYAQDKIERALAAVHKALELAEPEGYIRIFLDEGAPMAELLRLRKQRSAWDGERLNVYADSLLNQLEQALYGQHLTIDPQQHRTASPQVLVEPLSERECEVLRCVADGLSNREIADKLFLAIGTVKAHVHNIYGKLAVQSRTQAIARAREIGLL